MATCNDCFHYEACKKIFQIAFKDFTDYTFVKACELYKPTADVVEVVRCRDCEFRGTEDCSNSYYLECEGAYVDTMEDDDFCSYGERKEDE